MSVRTGIILAAALNILLLIGGYYGVRAWLLPKPIAMVRPLTPDTEPGRTMRAAWAASRQGDHQRAAELFTQALAIEPGPNVISQSLYVYRGSEYNFLNVADKAFADFDAAIRIGFLPPLSEQAIRAYMGRGYASFNLMKYERAKADFDVVLKALPDDVPRSSATLAWRGGAWQGLGNRERAVADYRASLTLDPKNVYAREGLEALE
jgi:tetratricopeptide (TPR) repeat protein